MKLKRVDIYPEVVDSSWLVVGGTEFFPECPDSEVSIAVFSSEQAVKRAVVVLLGGESHCGRCLSKSPCRAKSSVPNIMANVEAQL